MAATSPRVRTGRGCGAGPSAVSCGRERAAAVAGVAVVVSAVSARPRPPRHPMRTYSADEDESLAARCARPPATELRTGLSGESPPPVTHKRAQYYQPRAPHTANRARARVLALPGAAGHGRFDSPDVRWSRAGDVTRRLPSVVVAVRRGGEERRARNASHRRGARACCVFSATHHHARVHKGGGCPKCYFLKRARNGVFETNR